MDERPESQSRSRCGLVDQVRVLQPPGQPGLPDARRRHAQLRAAPHRPCQRRHPAPHLRRQRGLHVQLHRKSMRLVSSRLASVAYRVAQGNEAWLQEFESKFQEEFLFADSLPWTTLESDKLVGSVRTATGGSKASAGNVTFVTVFEAG